MIMRAQAVPAKKINTGLLVLTETGVTLGPVGSKLNALLGIGNCSLEVLQAAGSAST